MRQCVKTRIASYERTRKHTRKFILLIPLELFPRSIVSLPSITNNGEGLISGYVPSYHLKCKTCLVNNKQNFRYNEEAI
jgi:hypothetical protein